MSRRKAPEPPALDLAAYATLTDAQRAILDGAEPASRAILLNLYVRAREHAQRP